MTPYVLAMLDELADDLPLMEASMQRECFYEACMFRCSEILSLAPAHDFNPASKVIAALRAHYEW